MNQVLFDYGRLNGLAEKPVWIITEVLYAFFTDEERKEILILQIFKESRITSLVASPSRNKAG